MILAVAWAKQQKLIDQEATWYQQKWDRGMVLENNKKSWCGTSSSTYEKPILKEDEI